MVRQKKRTFYSGIRQTLRGGFVILASVDSKGEGWSSGVEERCRYGGQTNGRLRGYSFSNEFRLGLFHADRRREDSRNPAKPMEGCGSVRYRSLIRAVHVRAVALHFLYFCS